MTVRRIISKIRSIEITCLFKLLNDKVLNFLKEI